MGGERLGRVSEKLQNNALGRFRLETRVNIVGRNQAPFAVSPPVVPVPYVGRASRSEYGIMSTLQVAAHDMDVSLGGQDEVYFLLGTSEQHGALLANQVPEGAYAPGSTVAASLFYEDAYEAERKKCMAVACTAAGQDGSADADGYAQSLGGAVNCSYCPTGGDRWCRQLPNGGPKLPFSCEEYPPWDAARNLAAHPPRMSIDRTTGVVTWETGVGPFEVDTGRYAADWDSNDDGVLDAVNGTDESMPPLKPGFYSLVVEVRSASNDPDCAQLHSAAECADIGNAKAPALAFVSTTVDFLLYLHPDPAFCSAECVNAKSGIATFHDGSGFYGDAVPSRCAVCGGGETSATLLDRSRCEPKMAGCVGSCPGIDVDDNGNPVGQNAYDVACNPVVGSGQERAALVPAISSCVVNRPPRWVEYASGGTPKVGANGKAVFKGILGEPVTFDVILEDPDECNELRVDVDGLFKGHMMLALPRDGTGSTVCAEGQSDCVWDMVLGEPVRNGTGAIRRTFTWIGEKTAPEFDPRPRNTEVGPITCTTPETQFIRERADIHHAYTSI